MAKNENKTVVEDTRVYDELGNVVSGRFGYTEIGNNPAQVAPTAFPHRSNNIVPNSKESYTLNFTPNLLDSYDQYTYHWKLFITSLEDARNGNVLTLENQIIIAESGVSDLTIDKVELQGIAVPSVEAGTGTQTLVKFEIVEPSGAGLLDKMFYQATALGIGNWLVMPCFLQLEFRGRDPETSESVEGGGPSALSSLKWVWPIKLTNSKAHVTHVGTRYEFDAIIYDELAQSNSYFAVLHNVVLRELTTFEKAMKDLEDKLNADCYEKLIDNYSIPDSYRIVVDPDLKNIPITQPTDNKSTAFGKDFVDFKTKTASFNAGTGIDKIVDALLGNTAYFQEAMQDSDTPAGEPKAANAERRQMKKLWRVITETKPIAFDMLRQDNAVEITIYVIAYDLGAVDADASQTGQTPETLPAAKRRFAEYAKKKILNKKYDYIFTGLNDQIINFDLNMNFSFAASLARFGGIFYDSFTGVSGVTRADSQDKEKNAKEAIRKAIQFINSATPEEADRTIASAREALAAADISPENKARYEVLLTNAKKADRQKITAAAIANNGMNTRGDFSGTTGAYSPAKDTLNSSRQTAKLLAEPIPLTNASGSVIGLSTFISDVNINSQTAQNAYDISISNKKGKLRPIPFREGQNEMAFGSIDPADNAGRARVANIFSTALYSTVDASLQHIKLTIKGDPFWIFPNKLGADVKVLPYKSNMPDSTAIKMLKSTEDTSSVNLFGTDNFIVLRFRTPRIYNDVEGTVDPYTEVETFSGVYKVISITSRFDMGKFSQELSCILDPMINLTDFLADVENATKVQDTLNYGPGNNIPPSAYKYNRGAGGQAITDPRRLDRTAGAGRGVVNPDFVTPDPGNPEAGAGRGFVNPGPGGGSSTQSLEVISRRTNIPTRT